MQEKKAGRVIILSAFVIVICLSGVIWLFAGNFIASSNTENRKMAEMPVLSRENYGSFSEDFTSFFNDNMQFRDMLITLNSLIDFHVFRRSTSSYVVIGKDDYLFYSRVTDGDPISCYQGTNMFTEEQLRTIAENLTCQRDKLESQGKEFVILMLPNKERVYSEYMPARYGAPAEEYRALQVYNYLKENTDLRIIYPYDEIMEAKNTLPWDIYWKTDTHWTNVGSYIGAQLLTKELGIDMPLITDESISITEGKVKKGDLAKMLKLGDHLAGIDHSYKIEGYDKHNMEVIQSDFYDGYIYHCTGADTRKLYVIRDSFSTTMAPVVGSQFNDSVWRYSPNYSYEDFLEQDPDILVWELVERFADRMEIFSIEKGTAAVREKEN